MKLTVAMAFFGLAGFGLHFLARWGEYWRTQARLSPWGYMSLDPPAWLASILATSVGLPLATMFMPFDPIAIPDPMVREQLEIMAALSLGYNASSLAAKLPGLVVPGQPGQKTGIR